MPKPSVGEFLATRLPTLAPPKHATRPPNPFTALRMLNWRQWQFFLIAFAGWTWDAFDFFTVSLVITPLQKQFHKTAAQITWGITLVLMFRSVGAILFGIAADRYGRKWPFVINNVLFIVLELGTGFTNTYSQFLAVRALFGIAMGGIYGNCAATALEDAPPEARGILSGMLQQGYAFGYLLATVFSRALVTTTPHGWRSLFWFAACPPVLIIIGRLMLPETNTFLERQRVRESGSDVGHVFLREAKVGVRKYWLRLLYLILLMAGFNFMSHGSQDLYPQLLENQLEFSSNAVTVTQVVANLGAMTGGTIVGYFSQIIGRRTSIIGASIIGGALLYPYCFVRDKSVIAAAFFEQAMVQGAWGVIPIHLMELAPASLRTFVVGTSYQVGNLVSSASSTIESTIGERFPLPPTKDGTKRYDYGKVMAIFMGCVYAYVIILTFFGPEDLNRDMTVAHDKEITAVVGKGEVERVMDGEHAQHHQQNRHSPVSGEKDIEWEGAENVPQKT